MKATLVIDLVKAHSLNDDEKFKTALTNLIQDEEKKGNISLAVMLKNAYGNNKSMKNTQQTNESFFEQALSIASAPKDKDNGLDLLEIVHPSITLNEVALSEKAMTAIQEIIDEQNDVQVLTERAIAPTNRLLLFGPPGCGKTMVANAIAHELHLDIAYVRLDGLVSSYLGQTGSNIRKIFDYVRNKRIVLFLDEFDAIAKKRDDSNELGELKRVVTTLLQNLDTLPPNVFIIAATNHEQLLDPAIWRRFEVAILMEQPTFQQRKEIILNNFTKYIPECSFDIDKVVKLTQGMSGADIVLFVETIAKKVILDKLGPKIDMRMIAELWLKNKALFISQNSDAYYQSLEQLNKAGVSTRVIEEITGIARSTLSYQINKRRVKNEKGQEKTFLDPRGRSNFH